MYLLPEFITDDIHNATAKNCSSLTDWCQQHKKNSPEIVVPTNIKFMHNNAVCLPVFTKIQQ